MFASESSDSDDTEAVSQSDSAAGGRSLLKDAFCFCLNLLCRSVSS